MNSAPRSWPTHATSVADRTGWGPPARSRRSRVPSSKSRSMAALRATAYVLTSLASLVFLALVVYAAMRLGGLQDVLPGG